jgi:hypothetical protein
MLQEELVLISKRLHPYLQESISFIQKVKVWRIPSASSNFVKEEEVGVWKALAQYSALTEGWWGKLNLVGSVLAFLALLYVGITKYYLPVLIKAMGEQPAMIAVLVVAVPLIATLSTSSLRNLLRNALQEKKNLSSVIALIVFIISLSSLAVGVLVYSQFETPWLSIASFIATALITAFGLVLCSLLYYPYPLILLYSQGLL